MSVKWQDGYVGDWERFEKERAVIHLEILCDMYTKEPHKARISYPQ